MTRNFGKSIMFALSLGLSIFAEGHLSTTSAAATSCTSLTPSLCPSTTTQTLQVGSNFNPRIGYCPTDYYPSGTAFIGSNRLEYLNVTCLPRIPVGSKCDMRPLFNRYNFDGYTLGCQEGSVCLNTTDVDPSTLRTGICAPFTGFAGDSCSTNADCFPPRICSNGHCGIPESRRNAPCSTGFFPFPSSKPCPLDQFCRPGGNCTDYAPLGASCTDFDECNPTQGFCSNNKCLSFFSLDNGEIASSESLCKSGFGIFNLSRTFYNFICDNPPTDFSFLNKSCTSDSDCTKYGTCECDQKANPAENYSRCVFNSGPTWNAEAAHEMGAMKMTCENRLDLKCLKRVAPAYLDLQCSESKRAAVTEDPCFRADFFQSVCSSSNSNSDMLTLSARIGIGVGVAVAILVIVGVILYKKRQSKNENQIVLNQSSDYVQQ